MSDRPLGIRVVLGRLSKKHRDLVDRHLEFYSSLVVGKREPATSAQRHFVEVVKGGAAPETAREAAYLAFLAEYGKFQAEAGFLETGGAMVPEEDIPQFEEGDPRPGWRPLGRFQ